MKYRLYYFTPFLYILFTWGLLHVGISVFLWIIQPTPIKASCLSRTGGTVNPTPIMATHSHSHTFVPYGDLELDYFTNLKPWYISNFLHFACPPDWSQFILRHYSTFWSLHTFLPSPSTPCIIVILFFFSQHLALGAVLSHLLASHLNFSASLTLCSICCGQSLPEINLTLNPLHFYTPHPAKKKKVNWCYWWMVSSLTLKTLLLVLL